MANTEVSTRDKLITGEELAWMADLGPCELIDGWIVPMALTGHRHGRNIYRSVTDVREFRETDRLQGDDVLQGFDVPVASLFEE